MADSKATLTIKLNTPANQRWSGALPIEVRDEKLALKARGISDDVLRLPPGRYFVTALLPNGDQSTVDGAVVLNAGDSKQLEIPVSDLSFPPALETTNTLSDSLWEISRPVTQYFFRQSFAVIRGNWLPSMFPEIGSPAPLKREPTTRSNLEIPFSRDAVWIEIERSKQQCFYFAVPVDEGGSTTVEWNLDAQSGKIEIKLDFHDGELNSLMDFVQGGKSFEARSISNTLVMRPDYYATKKQSALRATLGAYVLIRANQLENLDAWTGNLVESNPWLPDTLAIRAEYLARNGRHREALTLLQDIPRRGAPLFRSGISYIADRARTYTELAHNSQSGLQMAQGDLVNIERIAKAFSLLTTSADMTQSTTALRGVPQIKSG